MSHWLLVTGDLPPTFTGGIASWIEDLARALVGAGHRVTVLGRAGRDTAAAEAAWDASRPYRVHRMWTRSWQRWQARWVDLHGRSLLAGVDHVLFSTWALAPHLGARARARGLPVGIAFHGSDLTRLPSPPPALAAALAASTARLPVSAFLAGELARLGGQATAVLPMPLPLPAPPAVEPARAGLVCVARLTPLKGVDRAIALARALGEPLTVVGEGPEEGRLRALAGEGVRLVGRLDREAVGALQASSRATLLLSRADRDGSGAEGLGLTLIEGMAVGALAIGSRTGGIPEAVGPGLVLDEPEAPALDQVRAALTDPQAGARARAWVHAHHGPARCLATLEACL